MKKIFIPILFAGILCFSFSSCIARKIMLSDGYYIKANMISENCSLYSCNGELVLSHIGEWMETQRYIYGYGDGKKYKCYIFDKTDLDYKLFYSTEEFYDELKIRDLKYNMTEARDFIYYK